MTQGLDQASIEDASLSTASELLEGHDRPVPHRPSAGDAHVAILPATGVVRMPAAGTVVVMRLTDWIKTQPRVSRPPEPKPRQRGPVPDLVHEWLDGLADPSRYGAKTKRGAAGIVLETSCAEIVRSGILAHLGYAFDLQIPLVGLVLARAGWIKRYVTVRPGVRERRYYRPNLDESAHATPAPPG